MSDDEKQTYIPFLPEESVIPPQYAPQWSTSIRLIAAVFLLISLIYAASLLAPVIGILTLSLLFAFVMHKPAQLAFQMLPLSWGGSVVVVYLALIIFLLLLQVLFIPALASGVTNIVSGVQRAYNDFETDILAYDGGAYPVTILGAEIDIREYVQTVQDVLTNPVFQSRLSTQDLLDGALTNAEADAPDQPDSDNSAMSLSPDLMNNALLTGALDIAADATSVAASLFASTASFLINIALSIFLSLLFLIDLPSTNASIIGMVPDGYSREYRILLLRINRVWNGFLRGQILIGVVIGFLTWLQLAVMGVPNAIVLAVMTGIVSLIPTIGGIFALVPLFIVPLITGSVTIEASSLTVALLVVAGNLIISQVIWNVVAPSILGNVLNLPTPVIIIGVFIGAAVGGILGAFLVAPIMSTLRVLLVYVLAKITRKDPFPDMTLTKT